MYTILLVIHSIIVLFLIAMVLLQRTDSDGMGGLSGGGNQFLTGRAQANLLTRTTAILAAAFFITSLTLAVMAGRMSGGSILDAAPTEQNTPSVPLQNKATETAPEGRKSAAPEAVKAKPKTETPSVPKPE